ncbi:MAG: ATP-dependent RecD-like DNA helicase [Verrucomicrobia subdivision 3 bacterium]|nr:ATP-dependent RecD-like DNA helicase [Limisphaerales bacterium]MCS1416316.1 ATP-dependent RecD-like DNA helicase [Limisphaerales bacterium]
MTALHSQPDDLAGLVERVTFFNEETGFAVLRVKVKGRRDLLTVVGQLPAINAGEWIHASGNWVRDHAHGLQLKATQIKATPPTTHEGMEKYLGSGMIKGIGPVYAKKLVGHFGEQIIDIIENRSKLLEQIEGIGPTRRRKIRKAWDEQRMVRDIMIFLHSHGVSTSRAVRIYKTYGNEAIETVRANPYVLCRDIRGIGFKTADQIAQKTGIPFDSVLRVRAGIHHILLEATGKGHCRLPRPILLNLAEELLQIDSTIIQSGLDQCLEAQELFQEASTAEPTIYLPALRHAERTIADRFLALTAQTANYPEIDVPKAIEWCQTKVGITLADKQVEAIQTVLSHRVTIITGGPGVGKTTLIRSILMILRVKRVEILLCAPTGRAAKRMTESTGHLAKTIHRLLEVDPKRGGFLRNESRPLDTDVLIVDECSMVDVPLMHHVLRAVPLHGHLILVGDIDQLPSIGPGSVLRDLIDCQVAPEVRLTEIFRQASGSQIITNAYRINQGLVPEFGSSASDSDFFLIDRDEPENILQTLVHVVKDRIPQRFQVDFIRDIQVLCPMNRGSLGTRTLNVELQNTLNPPCPGQPTIDRFGWQFRPNDKVIQTENNYDKEVFNGDIGQVTKIDPVDQSLDIRFDDRSITYDFGELDEISLAYAITIHKAQGSEFPVVVIPVATQQFVMLQRNLIYTGITRGKKLVVMIGQPKAVAIAVKNIRYEERFSGLLDLLRGRSR